MPDSTDSQDLLAIIRARRGGTATPGTSTTAPHRPVNDDPDVLETRTRRRGTVMLSLGVLLFGLVILSAMRLLAAAPEYLANDPVRFGGALINLVALVALAAVLTSLGITEKLGQPDRANVRQTARIAPENAGRLDEVDRQMATQARLTAEMLGQLKTLTTLVAAQQEILQKVPDYGQGVIDGMKLDADAQTR